MTTAFPASLAEALALVQTRLPEVRKSETATVPTKTGGSYKYSYADLAQISRSILPLLGEVGLSWIAKPTINEQGKFVLAYKLLHVSGESEQGEYPLMLGSPQEMGSAITYARRYTLCSVTGVVPDDDDDGAAATQGYRQRAATTPSVADGPDPWETATPVRRSGPSLRAVALQELVTTASSMEELKAAWESTQDALGGGEITSEEANGIGADVKRRKAEMSGGGTGSPARPVSPLQDGPIRDNQRNRLFALFTEMGITDRAKQMDLLRRVSNRPADRPLETRTDLTASEADAAIRVLEGQKRDGRHPEAVPA